MTTRFALSLRRLRYAVLHPYSHWRWALALVLGLALYQGFAPHPTYAPVDTTQAVAEQNPALLSDGDAALYKMIYAAQENGDTSAADTMMTQLNNPRLIGHVLAARYLSKTYIPTADELGQWLTMYGDHPQANRIARMAANKGIEFATGDELPLKGDGYIDHLGRSTMPDVWFRGLSLWRERNYSAARPLFLEVAKDDSLSDWQRSAGYYWAYRTAEKLNQADQAESYLSDASEFGTTFYGLLAAHQIGERTVVAHAPQVTRTLREDPRTIRAALLASLGRSDDAEEELRHLYTAVGSIDRPGIVTLASEMGLANLQVRLSRMKELSPEEALFANYPMPSFMVDAQQVVDPALLLAIARNESSFRDAVTSGGGAVGMMQMLPSTARAVERHVGREALSLASNADTAQSMTERLSNPALSAKFGAQYIKILSKEPAIGNSLIRLLAGYNAGPGAVAGWQSAARHVDDPLLYIESIPYPETHNYVMQVIAQYWVYQQLLGENTGTLAAMSQGQWPMLQS